MTCGLRRFASLAHGREAIPFHKFADLIKTQVGTFKKKGTPEVAFRVAVKHGKIRSREAAELSMQWNNFK